MQWDAVQIAARDKGQLVFAMDQAQQRKAVPTNPPWKDTSGAIGGYCMGLSICWMARLYAGDNLPFNQVSRTYDDFDWLALDIHEKYNAQKVVPGDDTFGWKDAVTLQNMRLCPGLKAMQVLEKPSGAFVCNTMGRAWNCYGIKLSGPSGAHAIAARHARDNHFHLFEPNYGHFRVKWVGEFKKFLDWYFKATGYDTRYNGVTFITGVRPPQGGPNPGGA